MDFFAWLSAVVIVLLVVGFLIGFWRNWQRALTRLLCLGVILLVAALVTPSISQLFVDNFTDGTVITIAGSRLDITEILANFLDESIVNDLMVANGTTNALVLSILHVLVNLIIFFSMFILLSILSLIIYWIVFGIIGSKNRRKKREEHFASIENKNNQNVIASTQKEEKEQSSAVHWILRTVSGFIGLVSMVFILFAFMTPVFGVMNICNKFVEESEPRAGAYSINMSKASASSLTDNVLAGRLYYKDNEKIGKVEGYIEIYSDLKYSYDHSPAGFLFNTFGISKLGILNFNQLTDVEHGGLKFNVSNELINLIKVYNIYKDTFVQDSFDLSDNNDIEAVQKIYDTAIASEISKGYVTELLPSFCERWSEDKAFLGIENPVKGDYENLFKSMLKIFQTKDVNIISNNFTVILDAIKIANNNGLIKLFWSEGDVLDYIETNTTLFSQEMMNMTKTNEFKNNIPVIFDSLIQVLYKMILEVDGNFADNTMTPSEISLIDFEVESKNFQSLVNNLASLANSLKNNDESSNTNSDDLAKLGKFIDQSRTSKIVKKPLETLIKDLVVSDKISLESDIQNTLTTALNDNWDKSLDEYSFETMLSTIEKTANLIDDISNGNAQFADLENVLSSVIESESMKQTIKDALDNNIIENLFAEDNKTDAKVLSSILNSFVTSENAKVDTLNNDITAMQQVVDMTSAVRNNTSLLPTENTQEYADELINDFVNSKLTLEVLQKANSGEEGYSEIKNVTTMANTNEKTCLKNSIEQTIEDSETQKLLFAIFGISVA